MTTRRTRTSSPTTPSSRTRATSRASTRPARRCGRWRHAAPRPSPAGGRCARSATCRWTPPGTGAPAGTDARRARASVAARRRARGRSAACAWSSNATFLVERDGRRRRDAGDLQAAAGRAPAVGLPRRHAVPARGRGVRAVATRSAGRSCPRPSCATVRSASGMVQRSSTTTPTSTTSRCSRSTPTRFRRFAVFDVLANNTDRKGGHCLQRPSTTASSSASTTASRSTRRGSCAR